MRLDVCAIRREVEAVVEWEVPGRPGVFRPIPVPPADRPFVFPVGASPGGGPSTTLWRLWRGPGDELVLELEAGHAPVCLVRWARIRLRWVEDQVPG